MHRVDLDELAAAIGSLPGITVIGVRDGSIEAEAENPDYDNVYWWRVLGLADQTPEGLGSFSLLDFTIETLTQTQVSDFERITIDVGDQCEEPHPYRQCFAIRARELDPHVLAFTLEEFRPMWRALPVG